MMNLEHGRDGIVREDIRINNLMKMRRPDTLLDGDDMDGVCGTFWADEGTISFF